MNLGRSIQIGVAVLASLPARAQTTERASVATGGAEADAVSGEPSISADSRYVVFWSAATSFDLGDPLGYLDVFVRDRQSGTTERVSVSSSGVYGDALSRYATIS